MVKRVLMVAFHYPPVVGSSGVQRTLKFSQYLQENDWEPTVLTVSPWAYRNTRSDQLTEIPKSIRVIRTWALDAARHLAIGGRYPSWLGRPDPWKSWWYSAVPVGLAVSRQLKTDLVWSTYPFPTAHSIAATISKRNNIPWVADFRDMMVEDSYPEDVRLRNRYLQIEQRTVAEASRIVVTAPSTRDIYTSRYASESRSKFAIIRNGYDEENFRDAENATRLPRSGPIRILHSGILYPSERDPSKFFAAIAELYKEKLITDSRVEVTLRATGHDAHHRSLIEKYNIGKFVKLAPGIPYRDALAEMMSVDGLLIFQAQNCNHQIPAKLYEYFRAGRPIFALTDPNGDTARTMIDEGLSNIAHLDSTESIKSGLLEFINSIERNTVQTIDENRVQQFSRRAQTKFLAQLFDSVITPEQKDTGRQF